MSIKIKTSRFDNVRDTLPKDVDLIKWLAATIDPPKKLYEAVMMYRETLMPVYKESLPCITISAEFKDVRNLNNIVSYSGLVCIDIDRDSKKKKKACNPCIDFTLAKEMFMSHPCTFFVGRSCSGDGLYVIIRIADGDRIKEYFEMFKEKFSRIGINIDSSCTDYTRLRIFSYDPEGYLNVNAKAYQLPVKKEIAAPKVNENSGSLSNKIKVEKLIEVINSNRIDITSSFVDWTKIGGALHSEFGNDGEYYFHEISKYHADYDYKKSSEKYKNCRSLTKTKLSSLFFVADSYGIRY